MPSVAGNKIFLDPRNSTTMTNLDKLDGEGSQFVSEVQGVEIVFAPQLTSPPSPTEIRRFELHEFCFVLS